MDKEWIPADVQRIIEVLRPAESYIVGGVVRDLAALVLAGKVPDVRFLKERDWDIATAVHPEDCMRLLRRAGFGVLPIGIEHGTVVVHGRKPDGAIDSNRRYEVTTFRYDRVCDGRHAEIEFARTLQDDLARRDFTVNALALDVHDGRVLDYFGGIEDLKSRLIRSVGNPHQRFQEDYLRLIRAIRFALVIRGRIEPETWKALEQNCEGISRISSERIRDELLKILSCSDSARAFLMMRECGLLEQILPELNRCFGVRQNRHHADDVGVHTLLMVDALHRRDPLLRLIALLHDLGKPVTRVLDEEKQDYTFYNHEVIGARLAVKVMRRLRFSVREIELAELLIRVHMYAFQEDIGKKTVRRWMHRIGRENFRLFLRFRMADRRGNRRQPQGLEPALYQVVRMMRQIEKAQDALSLKDLAINGYDLIEQGMRPGPALGRILNLLLEAVLDHPELNERDQLLELARMHLSASEG